MASGHPLDAFLMLISAVGTSVQPNQPLLRSPCSVSGTGLGVPPRARSTARKPSLAPQYRTLRCGRPRSPCVDAVGG